MSTRTAPGGALRRYPALGFLALAAALALLLPSALRIPLSGPAGQAEVAPVSGRSDAAGDLSSLDAASSGGLGFGTGNGDTAGALPAGPAGGRQAQQHHADTKRCVGVPPRQTEDPLSPACVPYFDGDNGGATARGVTRDEITVVVWLDTGSQNPTWEDLNAPITDADQVPGRYLQRIMKAFAKYFNVRYQTYGRTVHFWLYSFGGGTPEQLKASVERIATDRNPFAIIPVMSLGADIVAATAADRGIFVATYAGFDRRLYADHAPKIISYRPSLNDQADLTADYICTKLAGRSPRYGDERDKAFHATRSFGILYSDRDDTNVYQTIQRMLVDGLRRSCGVDAKAEGARDGEGTQSCGSANELALTRLQQAGVTTIIPYSSSGLCWSRHTGWTPEWVVPGSPGNIEVDSNGYARGMGPQWLHLFGLSYDVRRGRLEQQAWFAAFRETCPDCAEPASASDAPHIYGAEAMLLYGIQAAGPRLTLAAIDKGLHTIPVRPSPDPSTPAAYFVPGGYSFEKDAMEVWWDAQGADATSNQPGCYRLPFDGHRFRVGEWPAGDDEFFGANQPCQGGYGRVAA